MIRCIFVTLPEHGTFYISIMKSVIGLIDKRITHLHIINNFNIMFLGVEEHRSLGGIIISRLDNGAFVGLIYSLLVFS